MVAFSSESFFWRDFLMAGPSHPTNYWFLEEEMLLDLLGGRGEEHFVLMFSGNSKILKGIFFFTRTEWHGALGHQEEDLEEVCG
jgi:hypothetical protein